MQMLGLPNAKSIVTAAMARALKVMAVLGSIDLLRQIEDIRI